MKLKTPVCVTGGTLYSKHLNYHIYRTFNENFALAIEKNIDSRLFRDRNTFANIRMTLTLFVLNKLSKGAKT